jgi:hypothetical protein
MQTDFTGSQFPDDKGGDGSRNIALFTIKLSNMADSPKTFYPVRCCESFKSYMSILDYNEQRPFSHHTSVLHFFKSTGGIHATSPLLLYIGNDDPD